MFTFSPEKKKFDRHIEQKPLCLNPYNRPQHNIKR